MVYISIVIKLVMPAKDSSKGRFAFGGLMNVISFVASLTTLVVVAHFSARYASKDMVPSRVGVLESEGPIIERVDGRVLDRSGEDVATYDVDSEDALDRLLQKDAVSPDGDFSGPDDLANKVDSRVIDSQIEAMSSDAVAHSPSVRKAPNVVRVVLPQAAPKLFKGNTVHTSDVVATNSRVVKKAQLPSAPVRLDEPPIVLYNEPSRSSAGPSANKAGEESMLTKVQLDTFATHGDAIAGWFRIRSANLAILKDVKYHIDKVASGNGSGVYRLYVDAGTNRNAVSVCEALKGNHTSCSVVG